MNLSPPLAWTHRLYDWLYRAWASPRVQRAVASVLLALFVGSLVLIELRRIGILPFPWIPSNHFHAVRLGFNLLLAVEVLGLVFGLSGCAGRTMGRQFEILSLILLRQSLKELVHATEPIRWEALRPFVPTMVAEAAGAVVVFALVGLFYKLQREGDERASEPEPEFTASKEAVALVVLVIFLYVAVRSIGEATFGHAANAAYDDFFDSLYTVLVFADLLIVFLSLRHRFTYEEVFRNSGYAVVTVLIRIALTAPPFLNVALGVGATVLGVVLAAAYPGTAKAPRPSGRSRAQIGG
ncbi:MAG: hypothetical protein ACXWLG_10790 [Myxococcaceae bacterium]